MFTTARIWKFSLGDLPVLKRLTMPGKGKPLHFGVQNNQLILWAEVDPSSPPRENLFMIMFTGDWCLKAIRT